MGRISVAAFAAVALGGCRSASREDHPLGAAALRTGANGDQGARPGTDTPAASGDLEAIRKAKVLCALVHRAATESLPRADSPLTDDTAALRALADRLGVGLELVSVPEAGGLAAALVAGRGDIVGEPLLVDAAAAVRFATPLRYVSLEVVRRREKANRAGRPKRLWAQPSFAASAPVAAAARVAGVELVTNVPETLDAEEVLSRVGAGELGPTLARSDDLAAYTAYADDVSAGPTLAREVPVAWAVRPGAAKLLEAANALVYERALTRHTQESYNGDLDAVRRRHVLRVAMLNNAASYFLYRGQQVGFQFELAELLAARLAVRLEVVVPDRPADVWRLLAERRADLVPLTLTPETQVPPGVWVSSPLDFADQVVVQPAGEPPFREAANLAGKVIYARRSSAYIPALAALKARVPTLTVAAAAEDAETEDLIDRVGKRQIPLTVSNTALLALELTYRDDVQGSLVIAPRQPLCWAGRDDAPALATFVNDFIAREKARGTSDAIRAKYFDNKKRMGELRAGETSTSGVISPYDDLVRKYAEPYGLDWRLVVAQMYQESRFDPRATSWMGALGLLQVMPETGRELGFGDLRDPEQNVQAGVKYLSMMLGGFDRAIPLRERVRLALAAYNAGWGHLADARLLARRRGLDPNRWFHHVERAMLLLEKPEFFRRARRGYVRGREPVDYVSRIQTKYDAYSALVPGSGVRAAAPP